MRTAAVRPAWQQADTGAARLSDASPQNLAPLRLPWPGIDGAIRFTGGGQIADLGALRNALEAALMAAGGRIKRARADIEARGGLASVRGETPDLLPITAGSGLLR